MLLVLDKYAVTKAFKGEQIIDIYDGDEDENGNHNGNHNSKKLNL
jgi:hypothetical protein